MTNEFALNGRIHPLAAVIANAVFEDSLHQLKQHQNWNFKVIDALNEIGLTEPINFQTDQIIPSFFQLVVKWHQEAREKDLFKELHQRNIAVNLEPLAMQPLFKHPAFGAEYEDLFQQNPAMQLYLNDDYFCLKKSPMI